MEASCCLAALQLDALLLLSSAVRYKRARIAADETACVVDETSKSSLNRIGFQASEEALAVAAAQRQAGLYNRPESGCANP